MSDNVIDFNKFKAERDAARKQVEEATDEETLQKGVEILINQMERQDTVIQMLISDMTNLNNTVRQLRMNVANAISSTGAITTALEEANVLPSTAVKAVWERDFLPLLQGKGQPSPIVTPPPGPKIIIP